VTTFFDISAHTGQHLRKILQRLNFGFQNGHFFFGSLSAASILRFEKLTQRLCILMCFTTCFFSDRASIVTEMLAVRIFCKTSKLNPLFLSAARISASLRRTTFRRMHSI